MNQQCVAATGTVTRNGARVVFAAMVLVGALVCGAYAWAREELRTLDEIVAELPRLDVSGTVLDRDGNPVRKAEVYAYYHHGRDGVRDRLLGKTKTGRKGRFRFKKAVYWEPELPKERTYDHRVFFVAKHPDHGIEFAVRLPEESLDDVVITMAQPSTFPIRLTDFDDNPIAGVRVYLYSGDHHEGIGEEEDRYHSSVSMHCDAGVSSGVTDENGEVELVGLPPGRFWFDKEGYARIWGRGEVQLFTAAHVSGKVTLENGTPAPGAMVTYVYDGEGLICDQNTLTDEAGRYSMANAPATGFYFWWMSQADKDSQRDAGGSSSIIATDLRPGSPYVGKKQTFTIQQGESGTFDLVLERGVRVAGQVLELTSNEPVPNMRFNRFIQIPGQQYLDTLELKTDAEGKFSCIVAPGTAMSFNWEDSREGEYLIDKSWLENNNRRPWEGTVTEDLTDLVLKVRLLPVQPLTGRVVDAAGQGVRAASVYVSSRVPGVTTDETGAFTLKTAPADRDFDLFAIAKDHSSAGLVHLGAGATDATIPLEPTKTYEGLVTNSAGLPAPGLRFYMDLRLNEENIYRVRVEPKADDEGRFSAENLCPEATYYAWWSSDGEDNRDYDYGNATIDLAALEPGMPMTFEAMQYVNACMGRVVDHKGAPVEGAKIEVASDEMLPQDARRQPILTDEKGEFTINRLAYGEVGLRVSAEGHKGRLVTTPSDSIDLEVVLRPASEGAVCQATVIDEDGNPVANVPVRFETRYYLESEQVTGEETQTTDQDGSATFTFVMPKGGRNGHGNIGCDIDGYDLAYGGMRLDEDADLTLTLRKPGERWTGQIVDDRGNPVPGVDVRVIMMTQGDGHDYHTYARFDDDSRFRFTTDADGRFTVDRFSKLDRVSVKFFAQEYDCGYNKWFQPGRPQDDHVFSIARGGTIRGKVVVKGLSGALPAMVGGAHAERGPYRPAEVAEDGTFAITGLKAARVKVTLHFKDEEFRKYVCPSLPEVDVIAGETVEVTVEFEEGIVVSGKLVEAEAGAAPEGRRLVAAKKGDEWVKHAEVTEDGSWTLYLYPGTFDIQYYLEGSKWEPWQSITVERGKVYDNLVIETKPKET